MKVLILGSSRVGFSLANELVDEGHDVTVVSEDKVSLKNMQQLMDIRTISGRPSYPDVLRSARADKMDIMIAVTDSDEVNMISCQAGYSLFKIPLKIAKIRSQHYLTRNELFGNENLPVDIFLSPEGLVAKNIFAVLNHHAASGVFPFYEEKVSLVAIKITDKSSIYHAYWGGFLDKINGVGVKPIAIIRDNKYLVLKRNIKLRQYDEILLFIEDHDIKKFFSLLDPVAAKKKVKKVIIAGGGGVGSNLAKMLMEMSCNVKIIEHNPSVCANLSSQLSGVTILEGDASERNLLFQENVEGVDVFCALTSDDEDNIISSLQAKYLGAKRVVSLVNNSEYMEIFSRSDVDVFVPPQQLSISQILTDIRHECVQQVYTLFRGLSEVVSIKVLPGKAGKVVGLPVCKINFPEGVIFVLAVRGGVISYDEYQCIQEEDSLLFFIPNKKRFAELAEMFY